MIGNQKVIPLSRFKNHTILMDSGNETDRNVQVSLVRASEVECGTRKFELASAPAKRLLMRSLIFYRMVVRSREAR